MDVWLLEMVNIDYQELEQFTEKLLTHQCINTPMHRHTDTTGKTTHADAQSPVLSAIIIIIIF